MIEVLENPANNEHFNNVSKTIYDFVEPKQNKHRLRIKISTFTISTNFKRMTYAL